MNLARIALLAVVWITPALAAEIITDLAPPSPRAESVGHPRDGYVWAPGHWDWTGHAYQWVSGSWIVQRGKARWVADQWQPAGAQWRFVPGHWER